MACISANLWRLGNWAAESLLWHFAGMWLLALNGLCYLIYGIVTGRLRERLLPIRIRDVIKTVRETLHFHIDHSDLTTYNAVQKLLYIVVILAGVSQVISGLAIWKPIQFSGLVALLGGFPVARLVHFAGMTVIVGFLAVHIALSLLVPSTLRAMLTGGPSISRGGGYGHEITLPPGESCRTPRSWTTIVPLLRSLERRGLIRGGLSLGALTMLTGCDVSTPASVEKGLRAISAFNDRVQAAAVRPEPLGADLSGINGAQAAPVQRVLRHHGRQAGKRAGLAVGAVGTDRR